jgi:hypothetical protein
MTVAELIEELLKYPPRHTAVVETEDGTWYAVDVEAATNVGAGGCVVKIMGE